MQYFPGISLYIWQNAYDLARTEFPFSYENTGAAGAHDNKTTIR